MTEAVEEKKKRLTPKQWAQAEALYESGDVTLAELATKFGMTEQGIGLHMRKKKIVRGAKAEKHKERVAEAVTKAAMDEASVLANRIRETKEEHYKMASGLAKLAWAEILKAKQDNVPVATATNNLKALDNAMNVITKARQERWAVLGLDKETDLDDDGLPELVISELTVEQVEALRDRDFGNVDEIPEGPDDVVLEDEGTDVVEEA